MIKDADTTQMPANRMPLSDRIKKLTDTIRIHVKKPYGENKDDVELHEVVDNGNVIATVLKRDGKILQSNASPDLQQSGLDEKVNKAVGAKEGDTTSTTPVESAKDTKDAKQMAPERPKEHESREAEGKEKIKAPDSKEKKTKEPKEAKKPDNSMSKMASAESAETQGAAPLEKAYSEIKRVGDTLHYTRLGDEKKNKTTNPAVVPPHATQTPGQVATKAPATGPDQSRGTAASPQQPPAPAATAAPEAKQPPNQRWKTLFEQRKKQRDMSKISGGKGFVTSRGTIMVKSSDELKLEKDVVEFKKPKPKNNQSVQVNAKGETVPLGTKQYHEGHEPSAGHQGMFDILKRGRTMKPGTRDQKIKAALAVQAEAGSPYATRRATGGGTQGTPKTPDAMKDEVVSKVKEPTKPILVRDMNRLKGHTQSGRPFRVMLATHEDHANLPGYHMGLDKDHSVAQIKKHLSNPIHPITKAVYSALERGHDKLIVHNPNQPFKAVK